MKNVWVAYDRNLAEQFFRRTMANLLLEDPGLQISPEEVDYMAQNFVSFVSMSSSNEFAPLLPKQTLETMAVAPFNEDDRLDLQRTETAANQLLLFEGLFGFSWFSSSIPGGDNWYRIERPSQLELIKYLYKNSSKGTFRTNEEIFVLKRLGFLTASDWLLALRKISNFDKLEAWITQGLIIKPNE